MSVATKLLIGLALAGTAYVAKKVRFTPERMEPNLIPPQPVPKPETKQTEKFEEFNNNLQISNKTRKTDEHINTHIEDLLFENQDIDFSRYHQDFLKALGQPNGKPEFNQVHAETPLEYAKPQCDDEDDEMTKSLFTLERTSSDPDPYKDKVQSEPTNAPKDDAVIETAEQPNALKNENVTVEEWLPDFVCYENEKLMGLKFEPMNRIDRNEYPMPLPAIADTEDVPHVELMHLAIRDMLSTSSTEPEHIELLNDIAEDIYAFLAQENFRGQLFQYDFQPENDVYPSHNFKAMRKKQYGLTVRKGKSICCILPVAIENKDTGATTCALLAITCARGHWMFNLTKADDAYPFSYTSLMYYLGQCAMQTSVMDRKMERVNANASKMDGSD